MLTVAEYQSRGESVKMAVTRINYRLAQHWEVKNLVKKCRLSKFLLAMFCVVVWWDFLFFLDQGNGSWDEKLQSDHTRYSVVRCTCKVAIMRIKTALKVTPVIDT